MPSHPISAMIGRNDEWTVGRHLQDRLAKVVASYHRFIELAHRCGSFTYMGEKTAITSTADAGASPAQHPVLAGWSNTSTCNAK